MQAFPTSLSALLTDQQAEELAGLMDQISADWNSQTIWRTWTEANCSVLNDLKFPTSAAKYHQAKKEKLVFFEQLVMLSFDYRDAQIDLCEVLEKLEKATGHKQERLEVKRDRLQFSIDGMVLQAKERIREISMWNQIMQSLNDGSFDTVDKDTDELLWLTIRYCRELPAAQRSKDAAASINIVGQAYTLLKECARRGIDDQLGSESRKWQKMLKGDGL